jgi:hypothetical protein
MRRKLIKNELQTIGVVSKDKNAIKLMHRYKKVTIVFNFIRLI